MRYFTAASDEVYEQARLALDAAWGLPNEVGTQTCILPVSAAPHLGDRPMVAVADEWCGWPPADTLLPQLISSGAVEEIDAATYHAVVNPAE
jgi:hypothetical protein